MSGRHGTGLCLLEVGFVSDGAWETESFRVVYGFWQRLRGLLGTRRGDVRSVPLLLVGCPSVHTFGMAYPIDVVLVNGEGSVVRSWREVPAWRVLRCPGASHALERPSSNAAWPREGDRVHLRETW